MEPEEMLAVNFQQRPPLIGGKAEHCLIGDSLPGVPGILARQHIIIKGAQRLDFTLDDTYRAFDSIQR